MTATKTAPRSAPGADISRLPEHTIEIVSDSGEGAQKCGQIFGAVSAKMGNGVWTVEIIPAEIQPPPRVPEGASGNRIRIGEGAGHQLGRCHQPRRRLQRAGAAGAPPARRPRGRRRPPGRGQVGNRTMTPRSAPPGKRRWTSCPASDYRIIPVPMEEECLDDRGQSPQGEEHVRARACWPASTGATSSASRTRSPTPSARRARRSSSRTSPCWSSATHWAEEHIDFRVEMTPTPDRPRRWW